MYDMAAFLQTDSDKCLYEQIYEHIREEIKRGKLRYGERLPSTRTLADSLQVSRNTVDFAYEQLLSEGYIEARERRGYFVCKLDRHLPESPAFVESIRDVQREEEKKYAYDFYPNGLDMSVFPFGVWKRINKNILTDSNTELFSLGDPQGDYDLRETIVRYLHASRGVNCTPDQVVVGAGNDYLLLLLEKLLGRHIRVAMENPSYKRAYRIFNSFAYHVETVKMDQNGMRADDLRTKDVSLAYVMPSHQYPTGITMPIGRRMELLKWAEGDDNRYLIEDDYDSEFRYKGKPIPSLQGVDKHGKVIYIGTFSKAIAPAIRISFMVLPPALLEKYKKDCGFYASTVSRIDQRILNEFIKDGYFERYLNKTRKLYREKHDLMLQKLKPFQKKFQISGEESGLHMVLTCKDKKITEEELVQRAAEADVKVYPMSAAYLTCVEKKDAVILLGYGGLTLPEIEEGISRLENAWGM